MVAINTYKTVSGDTWDLIAKKTLGSEYYLSDLIEANTEHRETVIFTGNITLNIPTIEQEIPSTLPPWKRG